MSCTDQASGRFLQMLKDCIVIEVTRLRRQMRTFCQRWAGLYAPRYTLRASAKSMAVQHRATIWFYTFWTFLFIFRIYIHQRF